MPAARAILGTGKELVPSKAETEDYAGGANSATLDGGALAPSLRVHQLTFFVVERFTQPLVGGGMGWIKRWLLDGREINSGRSSLQQRRDGQGIRLLPARGGECGLLDERVG